MKISTRCRYGLRALADLALYGKGAPVPLHQIAQRQNLSLKYLEQEFSALRKGGFVRSVKGAQGGYVIARPAAEICVADVISHLEGDILLIDESVPQESLTPLRSFLFDALWQPLNDQVEAKLQTLYLSDLIDSLMAGSDDKPMYYI